MKFWKGLNRFLDRFFKDVDPTSGDIRKNNIEMTKHLWFNSVLWSIFFFLDYFWIGKIGTEALAAVSIGGCAVMLFSTAQIGLSNATIAIIGRLVGEEKNEEANLWGREILIITFLVSLILATVGFIIAPDLLKLLGAEPKVLNLATGYLRIGLMAMMFLFPVYTIFGMLRGAREMRIPMLIMAGMIIIGMLFDPLLILGLGPFPRMGVYGAAIAMIIRGIFGAGIGLWILLKGKSAIEVDLAKNTTSYLPRLATFRKVISQAGINTLELFGLNTIGFIMMRIVALWGTPAIAAYGIGMNLLMIASIAGYDLAYTTSIMISNNLGAGKIQRARAICWDNAKLNLYIMVGFGILFACLANQIVGIFDRTPEVISSGIGYLRWTIPGWLFLAPWTIFRRAFVGAQRPEIPLIISLFSSGAIQIPLAYYFSTIFGLGANGIWLAILIATISGGIIGAIWFQMGRWIPKG